MHLDDILRICSKLKAVTEEFPFDSKTLVLKVKGKMFALIDVEAPLFINLKCDPEYAIELRERYQAISPGYHMSKKHWITIALHQDVNEALLQSLLLQSYALVVKGLPKKVRDELAD
jgi:predicted DNA-binding protein (MmcQ/YjbR family)